MRGLMILLGSMLIAVATPGGVAHAQRGAARVAALERLAATGHAEAVYHLGMAWHVGSGVEQDRAKALSMFRRAANAGDPLAAYKLGCYYDGQGEGLVQQDLDIALQWKTVAAEAGYALAQSDVADMLIRRGEYAAARGWLEKAAAQGWPAGLLGYASIHNLSGDKPAVPRDRVITAVYFRLFVQAVDADQKQHDWLRSFEKRMNKKQREEAAAIVAAYKPAPTPLTLKALQGSRAAEALIAEK